MLMGRTMVANPPVISSTKRLLAPRFAPSRGVRMRKEYPSKAAVSLGRSDRTLCEPTILAEWTGSFTLGGIPM